MAQLHQRPARERIPAYGTHDTSEHYGDLLLTFAQRKDLFMSDSPLGDAIRCVWSCRQLGIHTSHLYTPKDIRLLQRHVYVLHHMAYQGYYTDAAKHPLTAARLSASLSVSQAVCNVSVCWLIQHGLAILQGDEDDVTLSLSEKGERMVYLMTHPSLPALN